MIPADPSVDLSAQRVDFERLAAVVHRRWGLRLHENNRDAAEKAVALTAEQYRMAPGDLLTELELARSQPLLQSYIRRCLVGETYFFRHPEHFDALQNMVVPALKQLYPDKAELRAWSAGCSTGEEPYSIAVVLRAALGNTRKFAVLATDLNQEALQTARAGIYGRWSERTAQAWNWSGLVSRAGEQTVVSALLKSWVHFASLNLAELQFPSPYNGTANTDVIFCRNVLVYFAPDAAAAILRCLADSLVPGGFLITSALDIDLAPASLVRQRLPNQSIILQRPTSAALRLDTAKPAGNGMGISRSPVKPATTSVVPTPAASAQLQEAQYLADAGHIDAALRLLRESIRRQTSPDALLLLGMLLADRGEPEAGTILKQLVRDQPDNVQARLHLGVFLQATGEWALATKEFKTILAALRGRADEELVPGRQTLPVGYVRRLVQARLKPSH